MGGLGGSRIIGVFIGGVLGRWGGLVGGVEGVLG